MESVYLTTIILGVAALFLVIENIWFRMRIDWLEEENEKLKQKICQG